jgi:uncharacterized protein (DUF1800 family)
VREGARALSGWIIGTDGRTAVVPKRHDSTAKTVLGVSGDLDAAAFCDIVLTQPKSAQFVAGRLWQQLAADATPSPGMLDRLVAAYGTGRDLMALTIAILTDPEFTGGHATVVNTPVEWLVGVVRALKVPLDTQERVQAIDTTLKALGQRPFYPPDVGGWPRGQAWLSTASADVRLRAATMLAKTGDLSPIEQTAATDRLDATGHLLGVGAWSDRTAAALKPLLSRPTVLAAAAVNSPEYLTS